MSQRRCCCGGGCEYWALANCGDPTSLVAGPRYVYARCDVYELQTGDLAANCPADWTPDPYIVWIQDPTPCELDPKCGFFRCAADYGVAPTQITTSAVTQGLQTTPPLTVTDACPAASNGPISLASRAELLAWLDLDDCCSDECGNLAPGVAVPCHLLSGNACTVALQDIAARTQFRWLAPSGSASGSNTPFSGGWTGSITVGSLPSTWTITSNPGGANGDYTMEWTVPVTVDYTVTVQCGSSAPCSATPTTQVLQYNDSIRIAATVSGVTPSSCSSKDLLVAAGAVVGTANIVNLTCNAGGDWSGGLERQVADDIGCASQIRFDSANYYAFAFRVFEPSLINENFCADEGFNTATNPLGYLEIITPLGEPTEYC